MFRRVIDFIIGSTVAGHFALISMVDAKLNCRLCSKIIITHAYMLVIYKCIYRIRVFICTRDEENIVSNELLNGSNKRLRAYNTPPKDARFNIQCRSLSRSIMKLLG